MSRPQRADEAKGLSGVDGEMSRFMKWIGGTHTMWCHTHNHTGGQGHDYQQRYKSYPVQDDDHFLVVCRYVERNALRAGLAQSAEEWRRGFLWRRLPKPAPKPKFGVAYSALTKLNEPLTDRELKSVRRSAQRGQPLGDDTWVESIARRLKLESTMRQRGRPKKDQQKEA